MPPDKSLIHLSKHKFDYLSKVLDLGRNLKVPKRDKKGDVCLKANGDVCEVYDLQVKFGYCESTINKISQTYKSPNMVVALDETLRVSHSSLDQLRTFMPGKNPKFGQKSFTIADSDYYIHSNWSVLPSQFSYWGKGVENMIKFIFPVQFYNRSIMLVADNYFITCQLTHFLACYHTSILATMRLNRIKKCLTDDQYNYCTKKKFAKNFAVDLK